MNKKNKKPQIDFDYYSMEKLAERLHPGEPVFIIRAADKKSVDAILEYGFRLVHKEGQNDRDAFEKGMAAINKAYECFDWQQKNPDKVKNPDNPGKQ